MEKQSEIKQVGKYSFALHLDNEVFTLSNSPNSNMDSLLWEAYSQNWENSSQYVGKYRIIPYGNDNMLPTHLRNVLADNNLAEGVLERQLNLLYGQGAHLSELTFEDGEIKREWKEDKKIMSWLKSWDYKHYIFAVATDYLHLKGCFSAMYLEKGHRINLQPKIARLEHISAKNARLEWAEGGVKSVKNIIVGDFEHNCLNSGVKKYPVFDLNNPAKHACSASYNHTYSFGRDFYALPQYWGALRWIVRGSDIPNIFKYVTENGINVAYHVHSPGAYWDDKRAKLKTANPDMEDAKIEKMLSEFATNFLKQLTNVLSGSKNAGKFFHTVDLLDENGNTVSWKIEAIDQNMKDFVESQLKIAEASVSAITSGMGLHPSLSNVMVNGKLASGSELVYAFKLFKLSDTEIPSTVILEAVNRAIAFNFPESNLELAFYHQTLKVEESVSPGDRVKNN